MTVLSLFSEEERDLIVSLPYKAGMWISYADDEDGEEDDEKEILALEACMSAVSKGNAQGSFVQQVAEQTLVQKDHWPRWAAQCFQTPAHAQEVVQILKSKVGEGDYRQYHRMIMDVATAVARAYGEFNSFEEEEKKEGFGALIGKIVSGFSSVSEDEDDHPMNVSASEDAALARLNEIFKS